MQTQTNPHQAANDAAPARTGPPMSAVVTINWLGLPWLVSYKGPYIEQVSINGHWLNAAYVLGDALVRDLEVVAAHQSEVQ